MNCSRCGKPLVHGVLVVSEDGDQGAMVGRECLNHVGKRRPMAVQTLIFPKERFGKQQAIGWAKSHGFSAGKVDETDRSFRIRQIAPKKFDHGTFRTIAFGKSGVSAVVARRNHVGDSGKGVLAERVASYLSAKGYPSKAHRVRGSTYMLYSSVPGSMSPILTSVERREIRVDGAAPHAAKIHALIREHFRGEVRDAARGDNRTGWFLVDRVTRTVRKSSEQERDAPPRYVKVYADNPSEAVRRAQGNRTVGDRVVDPAGHEWRTVGEHLSDGKAKKLAEKYHEEGFATDVELRSKGWTVRVSERSRANHAGKKGPLFLVTTVDGDEETLRHQGRSEHAADEEAIEWSARGYATKLEKIEGKHEEIVQKYAAYAGRDPAILAAHRARFGGA